MLSGYKYYLRERYDFGGMTKLGIGLAIFVIGGFLGFVYEMIFYWANSGFNTVFWRGTFGPWVDTYCITSLLVFLIFYRLRRFPWLVVPLGAIMCTLVQFLVGLAMYYLGNGARAWNCSTEILNYGNIAGFVCLRTLIEYAALTLLIMYLVAPLIYRSARLSNGGLFAALWIILGLVCIADIAYNDFVCVFLPGFKSVEDFYGSFGLRFMRF